MKALIISAIVVASLIPISVSKAVTQDKEGSVIFTSEEMVALIQSIEDDKYKAQLVFKRMQKQIDELEKGGKCI